MRYPSKCLLILTATFSILPAQPARAFALGSVISQSPVGRPLRVEILLSGADAARAPECLRVMARPGPGDDGIPALRGGRISLGQTGAGQVAIIRDSARVPHPVARLALEDTCSGLRREYILLFSEPAEIETPTVAIAPATPLPPPSRQAPTSPPLREWLTTGSGESLATLVRRHAPGDRAAQARLMRRLKAANPDLRQSARAPLPDGTTLYLPAGKRLQAASPRPTRASPASKPKGALAQPPRPREDRLEVQGTPPGGAAHLKLAPNLPAPSQDPEKDKERELLQRERQLQETADRQMVEQVELAQRLRRLETLQAELKAKAQQMGEAERPPAARPSSPPEPAKTTSLAAWPIIAAGLLLVAGIGVLLRRRKVTPPVPQAILASTSQPHGGAAPSEEEEEASLPPPSAAPQPIHPSDNGIAWESFPVTTPTHQAVPRLPEEDMLAEHDSVIELAEIMLSFGRVHGAAETLADFIKAHPGRSVAPWLKLLEVYHTADMRGEFEALVTRLHATFNVQPITWENFQEAQRHPSSSVEDFPHILEPIQRQWGSAECRALVEKLLRENRGGSRGGFPISVVDELLVLAAVLDHRFAVEGRARGS